MEYEEKNEELDQYDWAEGEEIDFQRDRYAMRIGHLVIDFSLLESSLNLALVESFHGGSHEPGYVVVEKLRMSDKIDLFNKMYLRMVHFQSKKGKDELAVIRKRLEDVNTFRNMVAHANWATLDEERFVRTKVKVDPEEGNVTFKNVKITTTLIRQKVREIRSLTNALEKFSEKAREWRFEEKPKKQRKS
jgi:hypothetical protein